jgi:prophage regulatory protein
LLNGHAIRFPPFSFDLNGGTTAVSRTILRKSEVLRRTGLSDTSLWRFVKAGEFPRPVQLGANSVGWYDDLVDEWIATRPVSSIKGRTPGRPRKPAEPTAASPTEGA